MSDFWTEIYKNKQQLAAQGHASYKKYTAQKNKIEGLLSDITKLHVVASNLLAFNVSSSAILIREAFDCGSRLAEKFGGNAPVVQNFFRYHQAHINLFTDVLQASNEATFVTVWVEKADKISREIEDIVDTLWSKTGFVGEMINHDDTLSNNLPREFRQFYESYGLYSSNEICTPLRDRCATISDTRIFEHEKNQLGLLILENARDIAGAFLAVSEKTDKFCDSTINAIKYHKKLTKQEITIDSAFGGLAKRFMNFNAVSAGATKSTQGGSQILKDRVCIEAGDFIHTSSFQRMGHSFRRMRTLSQKWKNWAKLVGDDSHYISA